MKSLKDYILCEQQKEIINKVWEAKYSNFSKAELDAFKDELESFKKHNEVLKKLAYDRQDFTLKYMYNDNWYRTHAVPHSDDIEYGNRYLLIFDNPFTNNRQLTREYSGGASYEDHKPCETNEDKIVYCIAIADKFNKLHIVNQWGNDCTVQYREKGLYLKHKDENGSTSTFYSEPGWYLYRKGYATYYVNQEIHKSNINNWWIVYPEKQQNTFVRLETCIILNISQLPEKFEKIQKEIEEKARRAKEYERERAEREKEEEARKEERRKREEEEEKWWKAREGYKQLGYANSWKDTPEIIKIANKDPEAKWYSVVIGKCLTQYFCDKYKITYTVDSSD